MSYANLLVEDQQRLLSNDAKVEAVMQDGQWRTPAQVAKDAGIPVTADITRRIRALRERGYKIFKTNLGRGVFMYLAERKK